MKSSRIEVLDGFRALAILAVMLYHFFTRWTYPSYSHSLYPYHNKYDYFGYGNLGVQFFFIISGFVIFFTLEHTDSFLVFWKKRMIRLFPSLLIATLITYFIFIIWDNTYIFPHAHIPRNFLPSLTFIPPNLFNKFSDIQYEYINLSYWSLWPEIQFYAFISVLYYVNKKRAAKNFIIASLILTFFHYLFYDTLYNHRLPIAIPDSILTYYAVWINSIFNLIDFLVFFSLGVLLYMLYKDKQVNHRSSALLKVSVTLFMIYILTAAPDLSSAAFFLIMFLLFFGFIYFPKTVTVFENPFLMRIGRSSYFLYLIHESIGVLLIYSVAKFFMPVGFLFTLLLIYVLIVISFFYTEKIDTVITRSLKKLLLPKSK